MGTYREKVRNAIEGLSFDDVLLLPRYSDVRLDQVSIETSLAPGLHLKAPIISSPMDTVTGRLTALKLAELGGLGVLPRNMPLPEALAVVEEAEGRGLKVAAAVGPRDDEKVKAFSDSGAALIVVDTAHGHSRDVVEAVKRYSGHPVPVMAGNIVTGEAADALIDAGASSLRVGVGPGHACTTREVAGVGMPQLTAVAEVADVARERGVSVVADGGVEKPADVVKALAAGADAVMIGYLFAGTEEAPGATVAVGGRRYKVYRGMGSRGALRSGSGRYGEFKRVPEGVEGLVELRGSLEDVFSWLVNGLVQGMGYVGARSLEELRERAVFVRLSPGAFRESGPRGFAGEPVY